MLWKSNIRKYTPVEKSRMWIYCRLYAVQDYLYKILNHAKQFYALFRNRYVIKTNKIHRIANTKLRIVIFLGYVWY